MYKLIIEIVNGSAYELSLDDKDLIDQIQKDNVYWVEDWINDEVCYFISGHDLNDEQVNDYYLLDPQGNRTKY